MAKTNKKVKLGEEELMKKTPKVEANIDQMEEMSGEKETKAAPRYTLPSVKLNGKVGSFFRTIIEDGELAIGDDDKSVLEDMGKAVSGVILKVRKTYFANNPDSQLYTNEVGNRKNEIVSVFCKTENIKGGYNTNLVFNGTPAQVKERYPEISMIQVLYFLLDDTEEIVRLKVKGMSLGQLFAYWKEFERNEHIFEYTTVLGVKPEKNKFGSFFVNTFTKRKPVIDMVKVQTAMKEVYDKVTEIETYYKSLDDIEWTPEPAEPAKEEEKPLPEGTDLLEDDKEIDVNKIPF